MTRNELYDLISLPNAAIEGVENYQKSHESVLDERLRNMLMNPSKWDEAIKELTERIGTDPNGWGILSEMLNFACTNTYELYKNRGIDDNVFASTMAFCTRFINYHKKIYGNWAFTWAFWFPRQLSLNEFRIEELEFEFDESDGKQIFVHVPSDADMKPCRIFETFKAYEEFLEKFYPEWKGTPLYCESWMMSPSLDNLLDEKSNIYNFKHMFETVWVDYDNQSVFEWVFPGERTTLNLLPENTSLQRKIKKHLLDGGKIGWAKGKLKKKF